MRALALRLSCLASCPSLCSMCCSQAGTAKQAHLAHALCDEGLSLCLVRQVEARQVALVSVPPFLCQLPTLCQSRVLSKLKQARTLPMRCWMKASASLADRLRPTSSCLPCTSGLAEAPVTR